MILWQTFYSTRAQARVSLFVLLLGMAVFASAATVRAADSPPESPMTLLIGLDGLRWDIIDRHPAPTLRQLAEQGVRAQGLIPVLPSKTFPNFYAIATGLYPENNGVMDNTTYAPELDKTFRMSDQNDVGWFQGEPIWVTAEQQGVRAATMFWVGSAAEISDTRPSYWRPFDGSVPNDARVKQVFDWLDLPEAERPGFISLYFEAIDSASHTAGVDSVEERQAVAEIDATIARLLEGLAARDLLSRINLVIVGDHGMTDVSEERIIYLDDYVDFSALHSPQLSGERQGNAVFAAFHGEPDAVETVYQALSLAHPRMRVYRKSQFPDWFRLSHPARGPDLVILPDNGWLLSKRNVAFRGPRATHGFSPQARDMHASLIVNGPAFQQGVTVESVHVVDIYGILTRTLGIKPAANDGNPSRIAPLFRLD
jgi:predicted AlkP superfamily pyrophosphatase or phosphodiesterase